MKYFFLVSVVIFMVSCASEPNSENVTASEGEEVRNVPATYISDACSAQKTIEDKRSCGDEQLLLEIDEVIANQEVPTSEMKTTKLIVEFTITEKGRVHPARILTPVHPDIDKAVLTHIARTKWTPSEFDGRKIKVKRRLPIYIE